MYNNSSNPIIDGSGLIQKLWFDDKRLKSLSHLSVRNASAIAGGCVFVSLFYEGIEVVSDHRLSARFLDEAGHVVTNEMELTYKGQMVTMLIPAEISPTLSVSIRLTTISQ
ncbi:MAG: hypothetical protein ACFFER_13470 [Candidatus Thorarchaeota archaeon]